MGLEPISLGGKSGIYDYPANFNQEKKTEDITHFHPLTTPILYNTFGLRSRPINLNVVC